MINEEIRNILSTRRMPVWHPIMSRGKPLFDALLLEFETVPTTLSALQLKNAMLVLARMRTWGDTNRFARALERHIESPSIAVRSEAAKYLAGLITLSNDPSHKREKIDTAPIMRALKAAQSLSLYTQVAGLVDKTLRR